MKMILLTEGETMSRLFDLPLLLAVLASSGQMEEPPVDAAFLGELALDGSLRPVSGVLPMALAAAADGIRSLYVPAENAAEAAEAGGDAMQVYPARTAREVVDALRGLVPLSPAAPIPFDPASGWNAAPDFADVMGQPLARRACACNSTASGNNEDWNESGKTSWRTYRSSTGHCIPCIRRS